MKSLGELMGPVLGRVSSATGSLKALEPVWRRAVGELAWRHSRPLRLEGATLVVRCDGAEWRDALTREEPAMLTKLGKALGDARVTRLRFEVG